MSIQKITTNPELNRQELRIAIEDTYLTIQKSLLKMIYKTEDEEKRKEYKELMKEVGKSWEEMKDKV